MNFYLVRFFEGGGKEQKVAIVAESQEDVAGWVQSQRLDLPRIHLMSEAERRKWRGATLYLDDLTKSNLKKYREKFDRA